MLLSVTEYTYRYFPALFFLLYFAVAILLALYSFFSLYEIYNFVSKKSAELILRLEQLGDGGE